MISATKLRNGTTFLDHNEPFKVIKYTHTHLSRGAGTIKLKVKNLRTGSALTKTYKGNDKVDEVNISKSKLQYLYKEGKDHTFMDTQDFEQLIISHTILGGQAKFLKEGEEYDVGFWVSPKSGKEEPLEVEFPPKLNFKVTEAAPGVKGDTQGGGQKDAVLENGLKVRVPLFIKKGDNVRVDTRSGEYVERVN